MTFTEAPSRVVLLESASVTGLEGIGVLDQVIARAIVAECPYLLMDEPTNHLDIHYQHEILGLVSTLKQNTHSCRLPPLRTPE